MEFSTSDYVLLALVGMGAFYFLFKDSLFNGDARGGLGKVNGNGSTYGAGSGKVGPAGANGAAVGGSAGATAAAAAGRDLAKAMQLAVSLRVHARSAYRNMANCTSLVVAYRARGSAACTALRLVLPKTTRPGSRRSARPSLDCRAWSWILRSESPCIHAWLLCAILMHVAL